MKFLKNISVNLMQVGAGVAGGATGRILANKVADKIPYIKDKPKLFPLLPFVAGLALMDMKGMAGDAGHGMAVVAGTDLLGNFVPMVTTGLPLNDELADELADELERRLNDDVSSAHNALNDDLNDDLSDDLGDDVSNAGDALNDDLSDDLGDDL